MAPHTINTTAAYRQLHKRVIVIRKITGSYSQNIIINAKANKYHQNHNQTILPWNFINFLKRKIIGQAYAIN